MAIDKEQVKQDYLKGMKYKDIAEKYDVSIDTVKSWVKRYSWAKEKGAHTNIGCTQKENKGAHKNTGAKEEKIITVDNKDLIIIDEERTPGLTDKQRLFVAEYLKDFNATRAAMASGYSKNTAMEQGYQLLHKTSVQAEIKRQTETLFESIGLTSQRILMEYMKIAGADINNYLTYGQREVPVMTKQGPLKDEYGNAVMKTVNYVDFKESSEVDTSLIQEVKLGKDGASIKLYDKMKAWEMLAKYMHLITDNVNVNLQQNNIIMNMSEDEIENRISELLRR